ncbi:TPA: hypothetical protein DDW35_07745 [Candidatus Sumerlaeota bacterium]|nr:hypothetical protein [Candidatus Sumerlaeota bacterium]
MITNNHVVEKAVKVNCVLSDKDQVTAEVLGRDPDTDLALLRLKDCEKKIPLPFAEFADSDKVAEGDFVMALGSPFGFSRSISQGIISNTQRYLGFSGSQYRYNTWLQTDAAINPGNSGGPLVNMDGRIVGINTLSMSSGENIGFAIPSNVVKAVSERLQKNGIVPRCWTGLKLQALKDYFTDTFTAAPGGVLISNVEDESPARFAGVHQGDILLRVNSEVITGTYVEDLPKIEWILAELPAERAAKIEVLRGGKTETLTLMPIRKGKVEGDDFDCRRWNMTVKEINKHQDPMLYFFAKEGVFVQGVRFPGNAAAAGVISGDIVKAVDGHAVKTLKEIQTIYDHAMADDKREKKVLLELERNRQKRWVALDYAKDYEKEQ